MTLAKALVELGEEDAGALSTMSRRYGARREALLLAGDHHEREWGISTWAYHSARADQRGYFVRDAEIRPRTKLGFWSTSGLRKYSAAGYPARGPSCSTRYKPRSAHPFLERVSTSPDATHRNVAPLDRGSRL